VELCQEVRLSASYLEGLVKDWRGWRRLAIKPRLALGEMYLLEVEDLVRVTGSGGVPMNGSEKEPLALEAG
jgi:hypothetical protein